MNTAAALDVEGDMRASEEGMDKLSPLMNTGGDPDGPGASVRRWK